MSTRKRRRRRLCRRPGALACSQKLLRRPCPQISARTSPLPPSNSSANPQRRWRSSARLPPPSQPRPLPLPLRLSLPSLLLPLDLRQPQDHGHRCLSRPRHPVCLMLALRPVLSLPRRQHNRRRARHYPAPLLPAALCPCRPLRLCPCPWRRIQWPWPSPLRPGRRCHSPARRPPQAHRLSACRSLPGRLGLQGGRAWLLPARPDPLWLWGVPGLVGPARFSTWSRSSSRGCNNTASQLTRRLSLIDWAWVSCYQGGLGRPMRTVASHRLRSAASAVVCCLLAPSATRTRTRTSMTDAAVFATFRLTRLDARFQRKIAWLGIGQAASTFPPLCKSQSRSPRMVCCVYPPCAALGLLGLRLAVGTGIIMMVALLACMHTLLSGFAASSCFCHAACGLNLAPT